MNWWNKSIGTGCGLLALALSGCQPTPSTVDRFEPNRVYARRLELENGVDMQQAALDASATVDALFGTPNEPRLPALLADNADFTELVSLDRIKRAAGPVSSDKEGHQFGLWQQHCATCHGITGDGRGPAGGLLAVYPRDFRMGITKFKSTPKGSKPTRDDLRRVILGGISGAGMQAFDILVKKDESGQIIDDSDLQAVIDYVIYLSLRGELERKLLYDAATELGEGERLVDVSLKRKGAEGREAYAEQLQVVADYLTDLADAWTGAADEVEEIELPGSDAALYPRDIASNDPAVKDRLMVSIDRGRELFQGQIGNCASCHGKEGAGDGQTTDYDEWTQDYTKKINIDPKDWDSVRPFVLLGAYKPRNIVPRNFREGVFRGGSNPEVLFRRVLYGIDGTPMPAATLSSEPGPNVMTREDLWHIINYVYWLASQPPADQVAAK